jgi:hypothetical protein
MPVAIVKSGDGKKSLSRVARRAPRPVVRAGAPWLLADVGSPAGASSPALSARRRRKPSPNACPTSAPVGPFEIPGQLDLTLAF